MTNRMVERLRVIIGGVITIFSSLQLFKLDAGIGDDRIGGSYSVVAIVFLCLGIFGIIWAIAKEPNERMWSSQNIKSRVVSDVIVVLIVCFIPFDVIIGDIYRYIDDFLSVFKNMALYSSISGLIFDGIHTYLCRKTKTDLNGKSNIIIASVQNKSADSVHKEEHTESAIKCPFCGYEQPADRKVCWKCAKPLIDTVESPIQTIKENISENKRCINCGSMINENDAFCAYCGGKVLKSDVDINKDMIEHTDFLCPNCGGKIAAGDSFCFSCGNKLDN